MSKKKQLPVDTDDLHAAQTEALAEEVVRLQTELDAEKQYSRDLARQVEALSQSMTQVATSIDIAPPAPAPLERPLVEIDGAQYRFKGAAFRHGGRRILATDVANDPARLKETFTKFPGLFEKIG